MPESTASTAPGIPGAAPVTALPNNGSTAVPTAAPTGQTSTASPVATPVSTPTAVVSSAPAVAQAQTIKSTVAQAQTGMAAQSAKAAVAANPYSLMPGETTDAYNARITAYNASKAAAAPTTTTPATQTPEEQIANTPDTGNQWIYDAQGNKTQLPIAQPVPPGYSTTNPSVGPTTPVADTTTDPVGNVYKQFTDGTYGKYSPTGTYIGTATANDFTSSKNGESLMNSIAQVANGTYPLTTSQQAQVDGITAQFQQLIQAQQVANANLTGGTTVAENLYGMGTSLSGLGEIKGTVDSGLAKIADLNSKLASAVATMETGFQTDDMTLLKGAYDTYSQAVKDRQSELDTMQAAAQKALSDAQAQSIQQQTLALTKMMDDNTISYDAKQQALAQSTLDEKTKDDLATQQLEKLKYNLSVRAQNFTESQAKAAAAGTNVGSSLPSVGFTASGAPDPVAQNQLLNSLPGGPGGAIATDVKGLANYTIDPTTFTVRTLKGGTQLTRDQYIALAKQYNPNYNEANYTAAAKYLASYKATTPNSTGGNIAAVNTAINHFADFVTNTTALKNGTVSSTLNSGANVLKNATYGSAYQASYKAAQNDQTALAEQLAKFYKGGGTADAQTTAKFNAQLDPNQTPGQLKGNISSTVSLLTGQLDTAYSDYENAMGQPPPPPGQPGSILTAAAVASLKSMGVDVTPYMGVQPYDGTSDEDLINSAPSNSTTSQSDTTNFFNSLP